MKEITNKHLFITMIIIGVITITLILSRYPTTAPYLQSYTYNNEIPLQASVYPNTDYNNTPKILTLGIRKRAYVPVITRTYTTLTPVKDSSNETTRYIYNYAPDQSNYDTEYYNGGYVPAGCENGTDYSITTGEPCG